MFPVSQFIRFHPSIHCSNLEKRMRKAPSRKDHLISLALESVRSGLWGRAGKKHHPKLLEIKAVLEGLETLSTAVSDDHDASFGEGFLLATECKEALEREDVVKMLKYFGIHRLVTIRVEKLVALKKEGDYAIYAFLDRLLDALFEDLSIELE